jgi:hypothetical protein
MFRTSYVHNQEDCIVHVALYCMFYMYARNTYHVQYGTMYYIVPYCTCSLICYVFLYACKSTMYNIVQCTIQYMKPYMVCFLCMHEKPSMYNILQCTILYMEPYMVCFSCMHKKRTMYLYNIVFLMMDIKWSKHVEEKKH